MPPTNCPHCTARVTPGAPCCLTCFLPFEDAVPVAAPVAAAVSAPVATHGDDFFFTPPPAARTPYAADAYAAPSVTLHSPKQPLLSGKVKVTAAVTAVAMLGLTFAGLRWALAGESDPLRIAKAFRNGRPPDFIPAMPDFDTLATDQLGDTPETPGAAAAYVKAVDPTVRAANAALVSLQGTLVNWAKGRVTDDELRGAMRSTTKALHAASSIDLVVHAPPSARRGMAKLSSASTDYDLALSALLDWLDSRTSGLRVTYRLAVGTANQHWDEGIVALYRAGNMPAPPLPHPSG